ncbi:MAG: hypothetical protein C4539_05680 [Ignavibacteriales bacterium]|nr:MAG: hypothetical protein C4539_05680 [Ignavibacteriales bacterium]
MEEKLCPICNSNTTEYLGRPGDPFLYINCYRCGKFYISTELVSDINSYIKDSQKNRAILSYWIRQRQTKNELYLAKDDIENILCNTSLPTVREQANNFILWLASKSETPDQTIKGRYNNLISILGCIKGSGVRYIIKYLAGKNYINLLQESELEYAAYLNFEGWELYDNIVKSVVNSRVAFMAMQYDNKILEKVYNEVIKEAVLRTGFEIRKLNDIKRPGLIDDKLRVEIRRSKFLIADLTDDNNGAYWEAGFAEGLGMPVLYICEKEKFNNSKTHFDTNHHLTILWKNDPESLKIFANELKATIRETFHIDVKMED